MRDPQINPITNTHRVTPQPLLKMPMGILDGLTRPTNQVLYKHDDDSLEGLRYTIAAQVSSIRSVRSWTILIERWTCETRAEIYADKILLLTINNNELSSGFDYGDVVQDICVNGNNIKPNNTIAFNTVMAAGVIINKIDAGHIPNVNKILRVYNVN